jgi:hypothetical protein
MAIVRDAAIAERLGDLYADVRRVPMLVKELEYYNRRREEFLREYRDKFVLIKGEELLGIFDSEQAAYSEGVNRLGNQSFLIKRVTEEEEIVNLPALVLGLTNASL